MGFFKQKGPLQRDFCEVLLYVVALWALKPASLQDILTVNQCDGMWFFSAAFFAIVFVGIVSDYLLITNHFVAWKAIHGNVNQTTFQELQKFALCENQKVAIEPKLASCILVVLAGCLTAAFVYENFEFWIDCRTRGAAGIAVRSTNRIGLGGDAGSGALTGNRTHASTPAVDADNADGEWNTLHVKVVDDRVTVEVNGRTVTENVILENTCAPGEAAYASGAIELLGEGDAAEFRDFYLCELPATPVFEL